MTLPRADMPASFRGGTWPETGAGDPGERRPGTRGDAPTRGDEARVLNDSARVAGPSEEPERDPGVEANARLTAATGLLLVALFFVEGLTLPAIGKLLAWHVAIGLALVPPVLLKIGSTMWRFARYYLGDRRYVRAGPPPPLLRALGPVVVLTTVVLVASGVALWLIGPQDRLMVEVHKLTFVLWFGVVALHLLSHIWRATRLAAADSRFSRRPVAGRGIRRLALAASLLLGAAVGAAGLTVTTGWSHQGVSVDTPPTAAHSVGRTDLAARER